MVGAIYKKVVAIVVDTFSTTGLTLRTLLHAALSAALTKLHECS